MRLTNLLCIVLLVGVPASAGPTQHDQDVSNKVRSELNAAFARKGKIAIATRVQTALASVTSQRDAPGKSSDSVLRDAEYYLHGLYGGAARDWSHILPTLGAPAYEALKWAALRCKDAGFSDLEKAMRTNPDNPVSEPGGAEWAYRGLFDGYLQDGQKEVDQGPGFGLNLPALKSVAPCNAN